MHSIKGKTMLSKLALVLSLLGGLWVFSGMAMAQTATENDDLLAGFEEDATETTTAADDLLQGFEDTPSNANADTTQTDQRWELGGFVRLDTRYNYAHE